jgi:hypothetical protein
VFIADQITLGSSFPAARARLERLAGGGLLLQAANDAYSEGLAGLLRAGPVRCLPGRGLAGQRRGELTIGGGCARLPLRWQTTGPAGPFPVLDGDLTLMPGAHDATVLALTGAYRLPPGLVAQARPQALRRCAAATIGGFLARLACAIAHPAGQAEPDNPARSSAIGCGGQRRTPTARAVPLRLAFTATNTTDRSMAGQAAEPTAS